jgi:hypothetical protein
MDGGSIHGREPNAGLDTGRYALVRGHEGDRDRRPRRCHLDPAPTELL